MSIAYTIDFTVPNNILVGLTNGSYERVGGVIREAQSKHIVAWLREGSSSTNALRHLPRTTTLTNSLLGASQILNLSLAAISIPIIMHYANRISEQIETLSQQIDMQFDIERMSKLKSALSAAANDSSDYNIRMMRISNAASKLHESYQSFTSLAAAQIETNPLMAQTYLG
ncbi:hypothetical protein ACFLYO_07475, partial [Chloroflexota bacterium]